MPLAFAFLCAKNGQREARVRAMAKPNARARVRRFGDFGTLARRVLAIVPNHGAFRAGRRDPNFGSLAGGVPGKQAKDDNKRKTTGGFRDASARPRPVGAWRHFVDGAADAPALWNGFPLLQYDTGGYLARWYEGTLVPSRAVVYGLILNAGVPLRSGRCVLLQVGAHGLVVRAHVARARIGRTAVAPLGIIARVVALSTLPWLTSILLTDIFCGLGVLALYLLLLCPRALRRYERFGLIALIAVAAATHSATLAVLLALIAAGVVLCLIDRRQMPFLRLGNGVLALALGAIMVLSADYMVAKRLAWTPGGFALSFGRMLQDGIVKKYLDQHCPDPALRLCAYKDQLPATPTSGSGAVQLFDQLGRFAGLDQEMETITLKSLTVYPALQAETAAIATAKQMVAVHTGEGVVTIVWHTYAIIEKYTPQLAPAMRAARQQHGELSFTAINALQYPLALIAMALLPVIMWLAWRNAIPAALGELAATVTLALLGNAFVCGALSNPHDRYGARMVWIAVFAVILASVRLGQDRLGSPRDLA